MNLVSPLELVQIYYLHISASSHEMARSHQSIILIQGECLQNRKQTCGRLYSQKIEIATDEQQRVKKWVLSKVCQNWKNYKSKLKKTYYNPFHTTWVRLQHRPDKVDPDQWTLLIEFWGSEEGTERRKRNSENRAAQTMNHTVGAKCFTRICEEEPRDPNGQVPDWMEMFRLTHTCRDGRPVDRASEDALR